MSETHRNGASITLQGRSRSVLLILTAWRDRQDKLADEEEPESDEPKVKGMFANAERGHTRHYETDGPWEYNPVVNAKLHFGFVKNELNEGLRIND